MSPDLYAFLRTLEAASYRLGAGEIADPCARQAAGECAQLVGQLRMKVADALHERWREGVAEGIKVEKRWGRLVA